MYHELRKRGTSGMRAPSFWWREAGLAAALLAPFATAYGAVAARRMRQPGRSLGIPVVCIGNLTLGGAGKTPTALTVGQILKHAGERPFFLTRGYGGRLARPVRVDPTRHDARQVGDEPLLLVRVAPTVVARDRVAGGEAARQDGASIVVMDDGFQNPSLAKHLAILVVDAARQIGNARVFPAGPLRAPLDAQLAHAHALVVIGEAGGAASVTVAAREKGLAIFHGRLAPDATVLSGLADRPVLAFAGIGDPGKFFTTLDAAGIAVPVRRGFPDHHRYTAAEAAALLREADARKLLLLTTEKDAARLAGDPAARALAERARALPVALLLDEEERFRRFVMERLKHAG
jgi:tetraacyldisaccharide 4'-kinase